MKKNICLIAALVFSCTAAQAFASEQKAIGTYDDWTAYVFEENGGNVCYMTTKPVKIDQPKGVKRGDEIVAMITHRPKEGTRNVFSYMSGYGYKKGSNVDLSIDGKKFTLFTQNDMAWAADASADNALAEAVKKGSKMVVKGTSSRGTDTKDTYSLKGATKAYDAISKACGL